MRRCLLIIAVFLQIFNINAVELYSSLEFYLKTQELLDKSKSEYINKNNYQSYDLYQQALYILNDALDYYKNRTFKFDNKDEAQNIIKIIALHMDYHLYNGIKDIYSDKTDLVMNNIKICRDYSDQGKYEDVFALSIQTINIMKKMDYLNYKFGIFPRYYKIQPFEQNKDCLWKISQYTFIYNNPLKWTVIYEANKKRMLDDSDPDMIFKLKIIEIPSINGEIREGIYDPDKKYPVFDQNKKY